MPWPYVKTVIHRAEMGSTSDEARALLMGEHVELPLLVRADIQTAGRGRGSNRWWSDAGSLTLTLGIDPARHALRETHLTRVALVAALALIEAMEQLVPMGSVGIRWPNDLETANGKLGGLLPERVRGPSGVDRLALGIGINVATRLENAPNDVQRMATSLERIRNRPVDGEGLLRDFLARIGPKLDALGGDDPEIAARWQVRDLLAGQLIRVKLSGEVVMGRALGIDPQGALRMATAEGERVLLGGQVLREPI